MGIALDEAVRAAEQPYLRNAWYQIAWSEEVGSAPFVRTILDLPILLFRAEDSLFALLDRCPHRFAPLSTGKFDGGVVECGYHGLAFDGAGRCVRNPHGPVTRSMRAVSFPVAERHYAVWIWFGDPDRADPALIPDLSYIDGMPDDARILMHMPTAANYRLLTDNIMDLSHADYLHPTTLGGMMTTATSRQSERGEGILAEWVALDCDAPGVWQGKIPSPAKIDFYIDVEWRAPAVMTLSNVAVPTGQAIAPDDRFFALHNMTPETGRTTHYFMCSRRPDHFPAGTDAMKKILEQAFLAEDKPMVEAQQSRIGTADFWSLSPILLKIDAAAVKVRRRLDALIAAEQAAQPEAVA